jgi:signal transduction histidine kinase
VAKKGPRSIRWWLGSFAAAVALPLLGLQVWTFVSQIQQDQAEARDTALRIARGTAGRIRDLNRDSLELLEKLAVRPAIRDFDGTHCDSLFALVNFFPQYVDLFLFDESGRLVCSGNPPPPDQEISLAGRRWIASERMEMEVEPSKPLIHSIAGQWVSAVAVEVKGSDGSNRGLLTVIQLPRIVGQEASPPGTVVTIFDSQGTVLARSDSPRWSGRSIRQSPIIVTALREKEGRTEETGVDGVLRQYGFTYVPEMDWYINVGVPNASVMEGVRARVVRGLTAGALILLASVLVAATLSRRIAGPIDAVAKAAAAVTTGAYRRVEPMKGPQEIVTLAESFNEMVESRSTAERSMQESERNLKTLSDRLMVVQESERTRIARELHDDLGQSLTALKMDVIGLLRKYVPQEESSPLRDRILETLDSTVTSVQRISSELRPSILDDLGLVAAIESEARLFEERTGIECELSLPALATPIDPVRATAIYRIIQEALTNVARHSNASRVELRLRERGSELWIELRDDGRGMTAEESHKPLALGLAGIRERATLVGGTAEFEGIPGRGTIVSVRIPQRSVREGTS